MACFPTGLWPGLTWQTADPLILTQAFLSTDPEALDEAQLFQPAAEKESLNPPMTYKSPLQDVPPLKIAICQTNVYLPCIDLWFYLQFLSS